jgi:hypothetical protein
MIALPREEFSCWAGHMSLDKTWEEKAEEWATFARSPAHDHFFWEFNGPLFLDLVPPPGRLTVDVGSGRLARLRPPHQEECEDIEQAEGVGN